MSDNDSPLDEDSLRVILLGLAFITVLAIASLSLLVYIICQIT